MYNDEFDKELIDYLLTFFRLHGADSLSVTSLIVGDDIYRIRLENNDIVLQLFYEKEDDNCEAQIRITNILLKGKMKNIGMSKKIINTLLDYSWNHNDMSLWMFELINKSWSAYLVHNGAQMIQEETQFEGAVLLIQDKLADVI